MARIRTIKPDFWTDEKIVCLPFEARLLFIGLWTFADDSGAMMYRPDRIRMQIFPADAGIDIDSLIDLLCITGLIERMESGEEEIISIPNWSRHQKIDNPSRTTISREGYRKRAIPGGVRVEVARKYSCPPGEEVEASCFYCGDIGSIKWWRGAQNQPTKWITLSGLEFDHFKSEATGGETAGKNIVLACRACNRGKREFDGLQHFCIQNSIALSSPIEDSPLEGKGKGREKEKEGKGKGDSCSEPPLATAEPPILSFPVVGDKQVKEWHLTASKLAEYRESFPGVDPLAECRKARQWCIDHPTKRKTFGGMPGFLSRWLTKAQDSSGGRGVGASVTDQTKSAVEEFLSRRETECDFGGLTYGE